MSSFQDSSSKIENDEVNEFSDEKFFKKEEIQKSTEYLSLIS